MTEIKDNAAASEATGERPGARNRIQTLSSPYSGAFAPSEPGMVSVVLPAYNEEKSIIKVINDVRAVMDGSGYEYEILVIDDASRDKTTQLAQSAGVRVIRHRFNRGSGASRRTGTINARGEYIVMLDADGTYEPKTIPRMIELLSEYDQVNGARTSEMGTLKPLRFTAKWIIRQLAIYISGQKIPDLNTGLKAFKRDVMLQYLWVLPDGFSCVTSMTLAFMTNGHPVKYVPTPYYKRIGKSKFHPVKDTLKYFVTILRVMTFFRPLRVYMPLAALMIGGGIVKGILDLFLTEKRSMQESDIILICVGFLFGGIGLLAELIVAQRRQSY